MKLALSLTLSFLLFAFVTKLPLAFSNDVEPVLDINGNPICAGGKYYIIPAKRDPSSGGGLTLGKASWSSCPVTVIQDHSDAVNGIPVRFSKTGTSCCPCIIFKDTPLEIEFTERPNCTDSSKWRMYLDPVLPSPKICVEIGLKSQLVGELFSIQKYGAGYKLALCDSGAAASCTRDVGKIDNIEPGRRLCIKADKPFEVVFVDSASYDEGIIRSVVA